MSKKTVRNYDIDMEQVTYQRQSFVSEISTGFYGVWWALTHPSKTLLRSLGVVGGMAASWFLVSGVAHLLVGNPGSAEVRAGDVGSWGRAAADVARQPTENVAASIVGTDGRQIPVVIHTREWSTEEQ
ncbi:MAG: hypothetical protein F6K00_31650 [Leptolyngbya sp. SIOISBB]|nr:hypothetical protein [Leptolyngbya sp. SIOISBB]